jgi:metal-responsive CopG/Arc/MetJ family transcriptional regulator
MARNAAKIAVSLPTPLYRAVEKVRRRTRQSRSAVVQDALREWLRRAAEAGLVRDYEAGYRALPEGAREVEAALAAAVALLRDADGGW